MLVASNGALRLLELHKYDHDPPPAGLPDRWDFTDHCRSDIFDLEYFSKFHIRDSPDIVVRCKDSKISVVI